MKIQELRKRIWRKQGMYANPQATFADKSIPPYITPRHKWLTPVDNGLARLQRWAGKGCKAIDCPGEQR